MSNKCCKRTSIGGQALIEAIMMRGPKKTVISCRLKNGEISTEEMQFNSLTKKYKFCALPFIRGVVSFVEAMVFGYKALMYSADKTGMLDEEEQKDGTVEENEQKDTKKETKKTALLAGIGVVSMILGMVLALVLFSYLPTQLFAWLNQLTTYLWKTDISTWQAVFEGVMKLLIFIVYIALVALMKDIKRTFMYHGAEHKTIACYENDLPLTVENVRLQRRFHPRCGTSFMILMIIVSIVIGVIITGVFPWFHAHKFWWVFTKLMLIPVVCGLGYELIKLCGRHDNKLTRCISAPGVWMQHITTKEPDDDMIEVAIEALSAVIPENGEDLL